MNVGNNIINRCSWVNEKNPIYVKYHDEEWGVPSHDDFYLYEILFLECFQAGLSWECVLNKREEFRKSTSDFDVNYVSKLSDNDIAYIMITYNVIKHLKKWKAAITNAKVFINIQKEYGSFSNYIWSFTNNKVIYNGTKYLDSKTLISSEGKNNIITRNELSDKISKDLKLKGMSFIGSVTVYSYLQAIGVINDHDVLCSFCINKHYSHL